VLISFKTSHIGVVCLAIWIMAFSIQAGAQQFSASTCAPGLTISEPPTAAPGFTGTNADCITAQSDLVATLLATGNENGGSHCTSATITNSTNISSQQIENVAVTCEYPGGSVGTFETFGCYTCEQIDLAVVGIVASPTATVGIPTEIKVTISGTGLESPETRSTILTLQAGSQLLQKTISLAEMSANGGTLTLTFSVTFQSMDSGPQTLLATIDPGNTLQESSFSNNTATQQINVQGQYALAIGANASLLANGATISIAPSIDAVATCPAIEGMSQQQFFSVQCINLGTQQPSAGCTLSVDLILGENTGGHDHGPDDLRPLGVLSPNGLLNNGEVPIALSGTNFTFEAPEISQEVSMEVSGVDPNGNVIGPTAFNIKVQMPGSDSWVSLSNNFVNVIVNGADGAPSHPLGFYGTPDMAAAISLLGNTYVQNLSPLANVPPILSQAASLPWGGLYDIDHNWGTPHCGHRDGETIDLSLSNLTTTEKSSLQVAARKSGVNFFYIPESPLNPAANHWHGTIN
jgi:hypothetical protein